MHTHIKYLTRFSEGVSRVGSLLLAFSPPGNAQDCALRLAKKIKNLSVPLTAMLVLSVSGASSAQTLISHDFDDGNLSPFNACSVRNPNYTIAESGRVTTFWTEDGYDGSRSTRGAELCADAVKVRKHGWYGMTINLDENYQTDMQAGVAQIFQFSTPTFWSWSAILDMTDGDLTMTHRGRPSAKTEVVIYPDFPKGRDMDIIMGFTLSEVGNGEMQVWVNGESRYHATDISMGFGSWDRNDVQTGDYTFVTFKAGQYNYQAADYRNGDTEVVYYDNISWYNGDNGYDIVDPARATTPTPPPVTGGDSGLVHMTKRNASGFAIASSRGASNSQGIFLSAENENNRDQQWVEINRGGGFYSYQKRGTNHCIDGNNGGATGQAVYLYSCGTNNHNQHWRKIATRGGTYRLQKRNSPAFSIDGNRGGANGQALYLWDSDSNNPNQQWFISDQ